MVIFSELQFKSFLWKGELHEAVNYLKKFEAKRGLLQRYIDIFERDTYYQRTDNKMLGALDRIYQDYYKNVFWKGMPNADAEQTLLGKLREFCGSSLPHGEGTHPEDEVMKMVNSEGYEYLGGKTQGFYGPYIWKTSTEEIFQVELPGGIEHYPVIMMDGFISRSWLDFISFGITGPGGWAGQDGILHCVRSVYNTESDEFKYGFLKHEAQHAYDRRKYPKISALELEYRAKLVELIYWPDVQKIKEIYMEADNSDPNNSHTLASYKIIGDLARKNFDYDRISSGDIRGNKLNSMQRFARELLVESDRLLDLKNHGPGD